jgi:hypothetical protein
MPRKRLSKYKRYERGQIIRVYVSEHERKGNEFYGNHYAIVIGNDSTDNSNLNIVYLTSSNNKNCPKIKLNKTIYEYVINNFKYRVELITYLANNIESANASLKILMKDYKKMQNRQIDMRNYLYELIKKSESTKNIFRKLIFAIKISKATNKTMKLLDKIEEQFNDIIVVKECSKEKLIDNRMELDLFDKQTNVFFNSKIDIKKISYVRLNEIDNLSKTRIDKKVNKVLSGTVLPADEYNKIIVLLEKNIFN